MAQGIAVPVKVENGRMQLAKGRDYIRQLIFIALAGNDSENPWQDIGLGDYVFGINDARTDGQIRHDIVTIFSILERDQLAKLENPDEDLIFSSDNGPLGVEKRITLLYTDMETQERVEIDVPLPPEA